VRSAKGTLVASAGGVAILARLLANLEMKRSPSSLVDEETTREDLGTNESLALLVRTPLVFELLHPGFSLLVQFQGITTVPVGCRSNRIFYLAKAFRDGPQYFRDSISINAARDFFRAIFEVEYDHC